MEDYRIQKYTEIESPDKVKKKLKNTLTTFIKQSREETKKIVNGHDTRLLIVVGPCSIHDTDAALDYARRLKKLKDKYADSLLIIMRVYFEKPRTTIGWKGLINDPDMDGLCNINKGLLKARKLLIDINEIGIPVGCELLDTIVPQYLSDLISYGSIGARTVESQIHRELASGVSFPVGFKNGTNGDISVAKNAVISVKSKHHFIGITNNGVPAIISTTGNEDCHIILRGSNNTPNYTEYNKYPENKILIDCSHGNSSKNYTKQKNVVHFIADELKNNRGKNIIGAMIESNIYEGKQNISNNMKYGVSITDSCISFSETEELLELLSTHNHN